MVLMVLSHTPPHGVLPTYQPTYLPTYPSEFNLFFIVQLTGRAVSSHWGKMDAEGFLLSLSGTKAVRKDDVGRWNCPVTVFYSL